MSDREPAAAHPFPDPNQQALIDLAAQYGFSEAAVGMLLQSLVRGGGTMAQFSHPEFGGAGQWTSGGMIMIGDMFNHTLKARVADLCSALARLAAHSVESAAPADYASDPWWGKELGVSSASGSQNDVRYAYFPQTRRLAIQNEHGVVLYDTGEHQISGVSQQQSVHGFLTFTSQHGPVRTSDLAVVSGEKEAKLPKITADTSKQGASSD